MQTKIIERYFFFWLLLATLLFTFFIFRPFLIILILGVSFAIVLFPIKEWLDSKRIPPSISSILTVIFFILVFCGPLLGIGLLVFNQSQNFYHVVVDGGNSGQFLSGINNSVNRILPEGMTFDAQQKALDFVSLVSNNLTTIFSTTLATVFSFLLTLLTIFYFLKDGAQWRKALVILSPLADVNDEKIISRLSIAVNGVIKGYLLVAIAQGLLMGVGLSIFGVPSPALWGVVAAVTSLIPTIGTALVSIPAILFLFATGQNSSAIGLIVWATFLVGMIDNFLSPLFISKKVDIPSLLIMFSVLGGISLFGPVGVLIGPLSVSLLYTLISIYRDEFNNNQSNATI
ncbi:MAG: AI-2E family transporter [Candidatus Pacebacteria bacterium]|nr:AI-2E family transporter [Candidatus Paceibacterota bacterium]